MSSIQALAGLAQKAGENQAFLTRQEQGQQLIGNVLRQRQQQAQVEQAGQEREIRLQQLAAQNESKRFQQALAAQAEERKTQQAQTKQNLDERETDVANQMRVRQLERLEADLGLRERGQGLAEQKFENQQIEDTSPKAVNKRRAEALTQLTQISKLLDPSVTDLSDQDRVALEQQKKQLVGQLVDLEKTTKEAARNAVQLTQVQQTQRAVTAKEAGPKLTAALKAAGQTRVLELPTDPETGTIDGKQLKVGKVYQTAQGPGVFLGSRGFEVIDELEEVTPTPPAQARPTAANKPKIFEPGGFF